MENCVANVRSGAFAGPLMTRPAVVNFDPWHGREDRNFVGRFPLRQTLLEPLQRWHAALDKISDVVSKRYARRNAREIDTCLCFRTTTVSPTCSAMITRRETSYANPRATGADGYYLV